MLKGKIIITTQPADQAGEMLMLLHDKGASAFNIPMIKTQTISIPDKDIQQLLQPGAYSLLVFTSKKGVNGFFENLFDLQGNYKLPHDLKIAVVGQTTGTELKKYGHRPAFMNPGTNAKDLAEYLSENIAQTGNKILLALSNIAPDFLETSLSEFATVKRINVYETKPIMKVNEKIAMLVKNRKTDMCIFTSPSGFYNFLNIFREVNSLKLAAIGTTTANAIRECGYNVAVTAPYPSIPLLMKALETYFTNQNVKHE